MDNMVESHVLPTPPLPDATAKIGAARVRGIGGSGKAAVPVMSQICA
jgi:hypothetical protein